MPDPAEQFHNPYLAMGNNPVMYVDPDGEFIFKFLGTKITFLFDFLKTGFTDGGFEFWNWGSKNFRDAWREFDPTAKWSKTNKALRMDLGLFKTDSDKNFLGKTWQFAKRHTWQKYNTILGNLNSHKNNIVGNVQRVDYFHGSTVVYNYGEGNGGSSLGGYININQFDRSGNAHETNFGNALLLHEYGHYLQEQAFGPLTLFSGINSGLSANGDKIFPNLSFNTTGHHDQAWFEQDANARSLSYFSKKDDFNNYLVKPGFSAADNFNAEFPFQNKTNRFLWYLPPFTVGIFYTQRLNEPIHSSIMNKLKFFIGSLAISFLITGCPEEVGYHPETPLLIKNTSNDSLRLKIIYHRSEFSDSTIMDSEISRLNLFSPIDGANGILFSGNEVKEYIKVSKDRIEDVPFSLYIFLINADTLNQYNEENWDRETGVKRYYFYDLEDYEEIDFTMEYP